MHIIIGLGNPGREYSQTRHNIGFQAIACLSEQYQIPLDLKKHKAVCGKGIIDGQKVILAMPQTYMNLSGESVAELLSFYKVTSKEIIVIYDDISLEVGQLRLRKKGSAGGHNGIKSIIQHLGTDEFSRIKFGVGDKPKGWDLADYVLGRFTKEEEDAIEPGLKKTIEAVRKIVSESMDVAMNQFNGK